MRIHWTALVFSSVNSAVQLLVPLYALHLGYPGLTIGILAALPSVANISLRVVAGRLSDRHGETRVLQAGGLFYLTATLGFLLSTAAGLAPFVCAQILQGVGRSVFWTVGQAYVTKLPLERGQHLSLFNGATNLGMLLGMSGAGLLVVSLGYPGAFATVFLLTLLYSALTYSLPPLPAPARPAPAGRAAGGWATPTLSLGPLWLAASCSFVSGGTFALAGSFYPVYLAQVGYGARSIGLLVTLLAAGMLGISFVARSLIDRAIPLGRLGVTFIISGGLGLAAVPIFHNWLPLAALLLVAGFCSGGCSLVYQLAVLRHSAWHTRGATMASVGVFGNLALLVLPTTIGLALRWTSLEAALAAAGFFMVILGGIAGLNAGRTSPLAVVREIMPAEGSAERT